MKRPVQQLPAQSHRIETAPTKFGDDWQGVFIRGDNAMWWGMQLGQMLELLDKEDNKPSKLTIDSVRRLRDLLMSVREV